MSGFAFSGSNRPQTALKPPFLTSCARAAEPQVAVMAETIETSPLLRCRADVGSYKPGFNPGFSSRAPRRDPGGPTIDTNLL